ncbi:MAG: AraC family transcriptional regulator [Pseudomonadota bacterium]
MAETHAQAAAAHGPLVVQSLTQMMTGGRWKVEELHSYDHHLLLWFTKGQGRVVVGGITRVFGPATIIFIPAGMSHAIDAKAGVFGTAARIADHPALEMPNKAVHLRIRDVIEHGEFVGLFENLQKEAARVEATGHGQACRCHAGLMGVWLDRQAEGQSNQRAPSAAERLAARYCDLLEVRFASGASVQDLAAELDVTATHLTRCCRQACGRTAHELLADRLTWEARDLLQSTELPINRIARDLGYTSAAYFTRSFQARTGKTPSQFRKAG